MRNVRIPELLRGYLVRFANGRSPPAELAVARFLLGECVPDPRFFIGNLTVAAGSPRNRGLKVLAGQWFPPAIVAVAAGSPRNRGLKGNRDVVVLAPVEVAAGSPRNRGLKVGGRNSSHYKGV